MFRKINHRSKIKCQSFGFTNIVFRTIPMFFSSRFGNINNRILSPLKWFRRKQFGIVCLAAFGKIIYSQYIWEDKMSQVSSIFFFVEEKTLIFYWRKAFSFFLKKSFLFFIEEKAFIFCWKRGFSFLLKNFFLFIEENSSIFY